MQYTAGTVDVTNGSATIEGTGTSWSGMVAVGDCFMIAGLPVVYFIQSITDDDTLVLSTNYLSTTGTDLEYMITRAFTPNHDWPEIAAGDMNWPTLHTAALREIDAKMKELDDRITALEP